LSTKYTDALVESLRLMRIVIEQRADKEGAIEANIKDWGLLPEDEDDLWFTLETMMHRVYDSDSYESSTPSCVPARYTG